MTTAIVTDVESFKPGDEIRNKTGRIVGIRPRFVWTWRQALAWGVVAVVAAACWAMIAVARGEEISAIWFIVAALCSYALAYHFYAYWVQAKLMRPDDLRATPAEQINDGRNFEPVDRRVVFGQHFAGISGAGPLVGPILACQMGYMPSMLWIIFGAVLGGCIQDMLVLWISVRRGGRSLGQMAKDEFGRIGGTILMLFLIVMTAIAMAFLAMVAIKAMAGSVWAVFAIGATIPIAVVMGLYQRYLRPGRVIETTLIGFVLLVAAIIAGGHVQDDPAWQFLALDAEGLVIALVIYMFAAAALPTWILVNPRDYLSTVMKIGTLALITVAIVIVAPAVQVPAFTELVSQSTGPTFSGSLFPFLFITIACGSLSGFHGAVSSGVTPKQIEKESQIRMVGYGSMLIESFTAVVALVAAITVSQGVYFSMNMSAAQIQATAGDAYSVSASAEDNAVRAIERMQVSDITGRHMEVTWDSVDGNGEAKTYEGAEALRQAASDAGEQTLVSRTGGITSFALGMANFLSGLFGGKATMAFWYHFAVLFAALFILTTVDNGTRVARYQIGETLGNLRPLRRFADPSWRVGNVITTAIAVFLWGSILWMGVADTNGGVNAMVPIFGVSNQLLGVACLALVSVCIVKMGRVRYVWISAVPMAFVAAVTFSASWIKIFDAKLGYFSVAEAVRAKISAAAGADQATLDALHAQYNNAILDGVLSIFFLVMIVAFVGIGLWVSIKALRGHRTGAEYTSEDPYAESAMFVPSGLVATKREKAIMAAQAAAGGVTTHIAGAGFSAQTDA